MSRRLVFACVTLVFGASCIMQNLSPETRLRDSVVELNEETRWGRMDVAVKRVAPGFRDQFVMSHMRWGNDIQIADVEMLGMNANKEEGDAVSRVAIRWYDQRSMVISDTVVRQNWKQHKQTYILMSESVESGHPGLLAMPDIKMPEQQMIDEEDLAEEAQVFGANDIN